jgi:hypothetical protein
MPSNNIIYRCDAGHVISASLSGEVIDLTDCICPVCIGKEISEIDSATLKQVNA